MTLFSFVGGCISEENAASIFRVEVSRVRMQFSYITKLQEWRSLRPTRKGKEMEYRPVGVIRKKTALFLGPNMFFITKGK
jgi:hypothetical protein